MTQVAAIAASRVLGRGARELGTASARDLPTSAPSVGSLVKLGRDTRATTSWPLDADLAIARNAHATNRAAELRAALAGGYDWLEVDVRRIQGELVASHGRTPAPDALRMVDWLRIGAASHRGLKLDFKERDAIAPTLDLVTAAGIPDRRLVINVPILSSRGLTLDQLRRIRRRFPHATINLCLGAAAYTPARTRAAAGLAQQLGGPVAFPLDLARVDRTTISELRGAGRVAVWNDPARTPVRDAAQVRRDLRRWGVDGTIDLR